MRDEPAGDLPGDDRAERDDGPHDGGDQQSRQCQHHRVQGAAAGVPGPAVLRPGSARPRRCHGHGGVAPISRRGRSSRPGGSSTSRSRARAGSACRPPTARTALTRNGSLSISASGRAADQRRQPGPRQRRRADHAAAAAKRDDRRGRHDLRVTLSAQPADQVTTLNRILLANPPPTTLKRRTDGLFQDQTGDADAPTPR